MSAREYADFVQGTRRFKERYFGGEKSFFRDLRFGQHPRAMVIGCSDSRVSPNQLLGGDPGDLFVVRNVANLVPSYGNAREHWYGVAVALEYAVRVLEISHIFVLGHSHCGGISALMAENDVDSGEFIDHWVDRRCGIKDRINREHPDKVLEDRLAACERASLLLSLANLRTYPWIVERIDAGKLSLHGWYFVIGTGDVLEADPEKETFSTLQ